MYEESSSFKKRRLSLSLDDENKNSLGKILPLVTNHYPIDLPKCNIYHYHIKINYSDKSKNGERISRKLKKSWNEVNFLILNTISQNNCKYNELFYDQTFQRQILFAFDGKENFYTCRPLSLEKEFKQNVTIDYNLKNYTFNIAIKMIAVLNLDNINEYFKNSVNININDLIRALDVIFKDGLLSTGLPTLKAIYPKSDTNELENENKIGLNKKAVFGHVQSVRVVNKSVNLIVDRMVTAFYSTSTLSSFYHKEVKNLELSKSFMYNRKQDILKNLNNKIKGLEIITTHLQNPRKYKVFEITKDLIRDIKFFDKQQKKSISVCQYYVTKYNLVLNETLPCLNVGAKNNPIYLPFEVCKIAPNQKTKELTFEESIELIKFATVQKIEQRFELIQEKVNLIETKNKKILDDFSIRINKNPILINGIQLFNPKLNYSNVKNFQPSHGKWKMNGKKVFESVDLKTNELCIVNLTENLNKEKIDKFLEHFLSVSKEIGMKIDRPLFFNDYKNQNSFTGEDVEELKKLLDEIIKFYNPNKPKLILFLIGKFKGDKIYKNIKRETEVNYGLITQCITEQNVHVVLNYYAKYIKNVLNPENLFKSQSLSLKENGEYIVNTLLLKINTKLGGTNSTINSETSEISKLKENLMVIGADVTHPSLSDKFSFSVCSVVASFDSVYFKYLSVVKIQEVSKEEMIKQMYDIILELLELVIRKKIEDLKSKNQTFNENDKNFIYNLLPQNIIYYRDGVSEGQYSQLKEFEINNMQRAFLDFSKNRGFNKVYKPKINLIIVLKRHNSRFKTVTDEKENLNSFEESLNKMNKNFTKFNLSYEDSTISEDQKKIIDEDSEPVKTFNIPPGTLVDNLKIVKSKNEFYLCSHNCDQGTIRSTHYDVLINENNFSMCEIQKFTYYLCYLFGKGTKAISIPTPVKYAHLAAYRARNHLLILNDNKPSNKKPIIQHPNFQQNPSSSNKQFNQYSYQQQNPYNVPQQNPFNFQQQNPYSFQQSPYNFQQQNPYNLQQQNFPNYSMYQQPMYQYNQFFNPQLNYNLQYKANSYQPYQQLPPQQSFYPYNYDYSRLPSTSQSSLMNQQPQSTNTSYNPPSFSSKTEQKKKNYSNKKDEKIEITEDLQNMIKVKDNLRCSFYFL